MKTIAVIGGGITGVTTAYALARRGFSVTLFERHRYAAMETSFANGGQLSASNAEVWTHWSTIVKGLKWMLRSDVPLLVNPRPSWHKLSWFAEFIASIPHYRRNTIETARRAIAAREHLFAWAAQEGIDFDHKREGILHIYRDKAVSIRLGAGDWEGVCATKIVEDELILVASPRLIRDKHICFVAPSNFICLRNSERDYLEQWNRQSDAQHQICERSSTVWFNDSAALLEAVENECGYTVTRKSLVWDDLKSGSLRQISDQSFRDGLAYYAVTEPRKAGAKIIQIFIKWLQEIYI